MAAKTLLIACDFAINNRDVPMDIPKQIARLVQEACIREACAPKPGNVNRKHDFSDTSLEDFLVSAVAIGHAFENAARVSVGQIIRQATKDCRRHVRSNTNLGIILLLAPLVKASLAAVENSEAGGRANAGKVREFLHAVLQSLTVGDTRLVYAAIRAANPGGLSRVPEQDVHEEPSVTLLEAMQLAGNRDSVASEYVTEFEITYSIGLPALGEALSEGINFSDAVVQAFLTILSRVPDTLIARKNGAETAGQVSRRAEEVLAQGGIYSSRGRENILELDRALRDPSHKLNPGTTADLTAAAVFLALLEKEPFEKSP
jgi:triphosphoribosyl-dephospho-CoA synthase